MEELNEGFHYPENDDSWWKQQDQDGEWMEQQEFYRQQEEYYESYGIISAFQSRSDPLESGGDNSGQD